VNAETSQSLITSNGKIKTHNVIWTAGTANNPFFKEHEHLFSFDKKGRVVVNEHLQVNSSLYVCGDNASTPHSGLALTAVSHATFIAQDIRARIHNKKRPTVYEKAPVQVVPAGEKWAVMQRKNLVLWGRPISYLRRIADFVGYAEVLGILKAITIWSNDTRTEETCNRCRR
jgi:NADH dehydrogenase FAD-containing subunit